MVLIIQALLLAMVALISYIVVGVFGGAWWLAFALSMFGLFIAWLCYLAYQAKHPDWWPSWDEGLPQGMRMMNAFVPIVIICIVFWFVMLPMVQRAKQKGDGRRKQNVPAMSVTDRKE